MKIPTVVFIAFGLVACNSTERGGPRPLDAGIAPGPGDTQGMPDAAMAPGTPGVDLAGFTQPPADGGGGDMAMTGSPTACGTTTCRGGQACVANACVYTTCTGAQVPGDYASVQAAATALANVGGTICLGAQTFTEEVTVTVGASLTFQGVSAATSIIDGNLTIFYKPSSTPTNLDVTVRGIGVNDNLTFQLAGTSQKILVEGSTVSYLGLTKALAASGEFRVIGSKINESALQDSNTNGGVAFVFDGNELTGVDSSIEVYSAASSITFQNNWVHDTGTYGVELFETAGSAPFTVLNNTFVNAGSALVLQGPNATGAIPLTFFNNLFVNNATAIDIGWTVTSGTTGNNALYDNTTNYGHLAIVGPGYVLADPKLTSASPPGLGIGSPARGTGDTTHAPAKDYWGNARGASVDIGAIQN